VDRYHLRLPYPPELFDILISLFPGPAPVILEVGAGTGDIARRLAPLAGRVDALDISQPMIEKGQRSPDGEHRNLNWILGPAETAPLSPPYDLIVGGESIRWLDWEIALPRFHDLLSAGGWLVLLNRYELPVPWRDDLYQLIVRYSVYQEYETYDLVEELEKRHLFRETGCNTAAPVTSRQSIQDYIDSWHSRGGLASGRMTPDQATAFDRQLQALVTPYSSDGQLELQTQTTIVWGHPSVQKR
jgi:SAM-dependent methyltransferase